MVAYSNGKNKLQISGNKILRKVFVLRKKCTANQWYSTKWKFGLDFVIIIIIIIIIIGEKERSVLFNNDVSIK
jgi:lipopolysaccharide/colanic/teichoic acid biosynthesis glycosyltransferase